MYLNASVPEFECSVRHSFLHGGVEGPSYRGVCFGLSSITGRALGFHVLLSNGAVIWRLPIHSLHHRVLSECPRIAAAGDLQLWDCPSYHLSVTRFDWLAERRVGVSLPDRKRYGGHYIFTVDWAESSTSERSGDTGHKCGHFVRLDCGVFALQPNNRLVAYDPSFVTPYEMGSPPAFRTIRDIHICEQGDRWRSVGDDVMFYGVKVLEEEGAATSS